ncbi:MAG TPA: 2-oxoacid:acceptor oxidoreductase family protein [Candidatus Kryptonia bacterium]|nr:2-oxoacid:acceptor oxidoreductase family protein [Candidatus Kryptonia bacterium]
MEREIILTGIGGQGIQLMAKVLAQAAAAEGQQVMLFDMYGGAMRGSASESTIVIGDQEISAPPIIPHCWSLIAMHPASLASLALKLRPNGQLFLNETLVHENPRPEVASTAIPATRLAEQAGNLMGAGMIMLGGFIAATQLVPLSSLVAAMRESLPPHRQPLADKNVQLLNVGVDYIRGSPSNESRVTSHESRQ